MLFMAHTDIAGKFNPHGHRKTQTMDQALHAFYVERGTVKTIPGGTAKVSK
jgi:hypothetical protein